MEQFDITKENGKHIRGFICKPDTCLEAPLPAVVFSHGFGSSCRFFFHHAKELTATGIVCVFFDFVGGGMECYSDGEMKEMTLLTEVSDLSDVLSYISTLNFIDMNKLFLWGESQGGVISTLVAAKKEYNFLGLALWYPAYVIPDDSKKRLEKGDTSIFGIELNADYDRIAADMDLFNEMEKCTMPVIIIHGDKDPVVPIDYSKKALTKFTNASLIVIPGAEHGYNEKQSDYAKACMISFMKFFL